VAPGGSKNAPSRSKGVSRKPAKKKFVFSRERQWSFMEQRELSLEPQLAGQVGGLFAFKQALEGREYAGEYNRCPECACRYDCCMAASCAGRIF
jgi:hypothetical protein